eukprot:457363-Rhodomonas_salina.1
MSQHRPGSIVSCTVCRRVKELDARGYPLDAGSSTVLARCGHHFCSECLLERSARSSEGRAHEYRCEHPGCGQTVAPFVIRRNIGDGTEPFTTECGCAQKFVGARGQPYEADLHEVEPAQAAEECTLLVLPPTVLGYVWPAERGIMGMRVCKQLRRDLIVHCGSVVLVQKAGTTLSEHCVSEDFRRLPEDLMVTLKWKDQDFETSLLRVLGECKRLAHLDLSYNNIDAEGAGILT